MFAGRAGAILTLAVGAGAAITVSAFAGVVIAGGAATIGTLAGGTKTVRTLPALTGGAFVVVPIMFVVSVAVMQVVNVILMDHSTVPAVRAMSMRVFLSGFTDRGHGSPPQECGDDHRERCAQRVHRSSDTPPHAPAAPQLPGALPAGPADVER